MYRLATRSETLFSSQVEEIITRVLRTDNRLFAANETVAQTHRFRSGIFGR